MYAELIGFVQFSMKEKKKKLKFTLRHLYSKFLTAHLYIYREGMRVNSRRQKIFHYIQLLLQ